MPIDNITEIATYVVPKIPRFPIKFGQIACKFSWACNHNGNWSGISFNLWKLRKDTAPSGRMEEHFLRRVVQQLFWSIPLRTFSYFQTTV